ncbi:unnamed protein product [Protopolystoma xenopodis]|uniref:Uncharacterized protein n=1 Tax=Protopolystoma xenopodis TaxID=117903 RepID=A0A448XAJ9_9PLAT|nr:unnamed protein product [Protopolystoma xenopodis]
MPGSARKDTWIMTPTEKATLIPQLRQEGNSLYLAGQWAESATKYSQALGLLEQLELREKPGDAEWLDLERQRLPFFINLAQCQYKMKIALNY